MKKTQQETAPNTPVSTTAITVTYDALGRKIQMADPDSGTWKYGYDLVGNPLHQDDPYGNRHIQFAYDVLNRPTTKSYYSGTDTYCTSGCTVPGQITYNYETQNNLSCPTWTTSTCPSGKNCGLGVGQLTQANDLSGSTTYCYDVRKRQTQVSTTITVSDGTPSSTGTTQYAYDAADHVTTITYPDGELLTYGYDDAAQVVRMTGTETYLSNIAYDLFGRPDSIQHGNGVTDYRNFSGASGNYRLYRILTETPNNASTPQYLNYTRQANGLITQVNDSFDASGSQLSDTATYGYDGVGRLTSVSGNTYMNATYGYTDHLGNMNVKDGVTYAYGSAGPHQPTNAVGGGIGYDADGNRASKASGGQAYAYDADDRLRTITMSGVTVAFNYDYTGRRVEKEVTTGAGSMVTRYYSNLAEVADGYLTKYYIAAGNLIASQRVVAPAPLLAARDTTPAVQLAGNFTGRTPLLVVLLRHDAMVATSVVAMLGSSLLFMVPGRRKAVVGIAVRRGHVLVVVVAFALTALPLPVLMRPAAATGGGSGPTPTPWGGSTSDGVKHYHVNHLGSVEVITNNDASVYRYIRYKGYGEIRGEYTSAGTLLNANCGDDQYCRDFTGYETETFSGLEYAGARYYDSALGMFLTHDPKRQFASPYTYGNWNPVNGTDPNGTICVIDDIVIVIVLAVLSVAAVGIDAAVRSGDPLVGFEASAKALASGGVPVGMGYGMQLLAPDVFGKPDARQYAISLIPVVGSAYGAAQDFRDGNYASGTVAAISTAFEAYETYQVGSYVYNKYYAAQPNSLGNLRAQIDVEGDNQLFRQATASPGVRARQAGKLSSRSSYQ